MISGYSPGDYLAKITALKYDGLVVESLDIIKKLNKKKD